MAKLVLNRAKIKMNNILTQDLKHAALFAKNSITAGQFLNMSTTVSKSDGSQYFVNVAGSSNIDGDYVTRNNFSNISYNSSTGVFINTNYIMNFFINKNLTVNQLVFTKEVEGNVMAIITLPDIRKDNDSAVFVGEVKIEFRG